MAWCSECNKECDLITTDIGIGSYEFWGSQCNDSCMVVVSRCCEADAYAERQIQDDENDVPVACYYQLITQLDDVIQDYDM